MSSVSSFIAALLLIASAQDKPSVCEWRGPGRTGVYNESSLLKIWPSEGPKELWAVDNIGNGFVSPVFSGERFYISGAFDSTTYLFCYNLNGLKQWQTAIGKEWVKSYPGARSAPTVDGDMVYVGTGRGNLFCINKNSGKIIWSKDLVTDFQGVLPMHGHSESAVVNGNKVYWTPGGKENNVVALDRMTGKIIWSNKGFGERSGYNPSKLIDHPSGKIFVTFSAYHMMGFDAETGKLLWAHEQDNYPAEKRDLGVGDTHANAILYDNGSIYYAEGDGNCGVKLNISPDGKKITEVWRNKGFDNFMGGIVKIGDYLYGSGTVNNIKSLNAVSGVITDSLKIGMGAIIAADDMLYYYSQKGDMFLLSYNNGNIEKVSSFRIKKGNQQHFSHPVIYRGVLYQRHGNTLLAYDIRKK
jgi:outer membrane protein assembly factor BamB